MPHGLFSALDPALKFTYSCPADNKKKKDSPYHSSPFFLHRIENHA